MCYLKLREELVLGLNQVSTKHPFSAGTISYHSEELGLLLFGGSLEAEVCGNGGGSESGSGNERFHV